MNQIFVISLKMYVLVLELELVLFHHDESMFVQQESVDTRSFLTETIPPIWTNNHVTDRPLLLNL